MAVSNITLTPIQEMAPGQVTAIRNSVIDAVVAKASSELSLPANKLIIRDIRPYHDLDFADNTDYLTEVCNIDTWGAFYSGGAQVVSPAASGNYYDAIADGTTMADNRYVALYGVRDMRVSLNAIIAQNISLIKFNIGAADRIIWDLSKCENFKNYIAGVTPSPVVIPPLAPYQVSCYLMADSIAPYLQLMGFVVEPIGLLITP